MRGDRRIALKSGKHDDMREGARSRFATRMGKGVV